MAITCGKNAYWVAKRGIVQNGLVLNLDAAVTDSYPGYGTTWRDLSGNGNNGTLTNGPTFNSEKGGSLIFDGTNQYTTISSSNTFNQTTQITVSVFVYISQVLACCDTFISKYTQVNSSADGLKWILRMEGSKVSWYTNTGSYTNILSNTSLSLNQWYFLTGLYNGSERQIFINGILDKTGSMTGSLIDNNLTPVRIAASGYQGVSEYFKGRVAMAQIYNRALTANEVQQNFNATRSRFGV
jgi:hypothetical protein